MTDASPTPARTAAAAPLVCYDGDCGLCRASVEFLARAGLVPRGRMAPFQSFDADVARLLLDANVHNELAVLELASLEVRSGVDGLLWALEGSWLSPLLRLARPAWVRRPLRVLYRLVAYNRRILSPVRDAGVRCSCDPDFHAGLRLGFVLLAWAATAALGAFALGRPWEVGAGALALAAPAALRPGTARAEALAHAAWVGLLATVAALPFALWPHPAWVALPALALLTSARRRARALGLHPALALGVVAVACGAALLVAA